MFELHLNFVGQEINYLKLLLFNDYVININTDIKKLWLSAVYILFYKKKAMASMSQLKKFLVQKKGHSNS